MNDTSVEKCCTCSDYSGGAVIGSTFYCEKCSLPRKPAQPISQSVVEWENEVVVMMHRSLQNGASESPRLIKFITQLLSRQAKSGRNIGALRQWLNERTETRLITNEDIETFLNL